MRTLFLMLAVLGLTAAPAGAVSGGTEEPLAQAPYVASIAGRCTGTLISPTRILTAAHCLDGDNATDDLIVVGIDANQSAYGALRKAALPIRGYSVDPAFHESFPFAHTNPSNAIAVHDIGLVLLRTPVTGIAPVALGDAPPGSAVTLIGYGQTSANASNADKPLQQGAVTVIAPSACRDAFPHAISATMLCTEDVARHTPLIQACPGDSGGPTVALTPTGPVQIGITSWGPEVKNGRCGKQYLPNVSMRVSSYTSFITAAHPPIEPYLRTRGSFTHIKGTAAVGHTVTCQVPKLGGGRAKRFYAWQLIRGVKFSTLTARGSKLTITGAMRGGGLYCLVTARNRGGSLQVPTGLVTVRS